MSKKAKVLPEKSEADVQKIALAHAALRPSVNAAVVVAAYQTNLMGKDVDLAALIDRLCETFGKTRDGDLSNLEAMLIAQATALQTVFTSLAKRAQSQQYQKNFESILGLALKAQAQSRATIQAVVDLKYPRQVAFVKQANISHGPQQVNNGDSRSNTRTGAHTEENQLQQNKLLVDQSHERTPLDIGATTKAGRSDPALETMGTVHRTKKRTGQGQSVR